MEVKLTMMTQSRMLDTMLQRLTLMRERKGALVNNSNKTATVL